MGLKIGNLVPFSVSFQIWELQIIANSHQQSHQQKSYVGR